MRSQTLAPKAQTFPQKAHDPLRSLRVEQTLKEERVAVDMASGDAAKRLRGCLDYSGVKGLGFRVLHRAFSIQARYSGTTDPVEPATLGEHVFFYFASEP